MSYGEHLTQRSPGIVPERQLFHLGSQIGGGHANTQSFPSRGERRINSKCHHSNIR